MSECPAERQRMYALINPDPLYQVSARWLAREAGCSVGIVSDLRRGKIPVVSERIARDISEALGKPLETLFKLTDRMGWVRKY